MPAPAPPPDPDAQQQAEAALRDAVAARLGVELRAATLALPGGASVDVDGADAAQSVFVELVTRHGRLKGQQLDKVARDALKLVTLARAFGGARIAMAFADPDAAASVTGGSWLAEALRTWRVEVVVPGDAPT